MKTNLILFLSIIVMFIIFITTGCDFFSNNDGGEPTPGTTPEITEEPIETPDPTETPGPTPTTTPAAASWTAYNDCVSSGTGNAANVTKFDFNNTAGTLLKYSDGTATSVIVSIASDNIEPWNPDGMPNEGTDAYTIFNGIVNINEIASYSSSSIDWYYEITFTGLDPAKEYEFVTTANRNSESYDGTGALSRWSKFTINGADTYTNISSTGVMAVSEDVLKMNTGYNTLNGYVVAWSGITASDGSFTVRSENVGVEGPGEQYKSYGFQGFMFKELE